MTILGVVWIVLHQTLSTSSETIIIFGYLSIILRHRTFHTNTSKPRRFLTIAGKHATLSMLMQTVGVSVYKSFFIITGMFILIMCYSLIGVILFGSLKPGEAVNKQVSWV